jgi:hypothetical protein
MILTIPEMGRSHGYLEAMRRVPWIAAVLLLVVAACGQVEPVLAHVTMPDCTYQGATSMKEGEVSLSLSLNGLADAGVILGAIGAEHTYRDLETHLAGVSDELEDLPEWLEGVIDLRLSDAQALDGVEDTVRVRAGSYAVICVDYPYDGGEPVVRLATSLDVAEE